MERIYLPRPWQYCSELDGSNANGWQKEKERWYGDSGGRAQRKLGNLAGYYITSIHAQYYS
jgi:hypothetical protein